MQFEEQIRRVKELLGGSARVGARSAEIAATEQRLGVVLPAARRLTGAGAGGEAIRHYEVGLRIGELSLGDSFDGVLPWGLIDNRPFLRCLHNFGLCCWRLGRLDEAERVFDRMLWLNPSDNQGARFLIGPVRAGAAWEERDSR